MKKFMMIVLLSGIVFLPALPALAQLNSVRFEQLDSLQQAETRPVVVFISTDWCRYCSRMKRTTLRDERVVKELSGKFYFVPLNAEERKDISFHGHTFRYRPTGNGTGVHELAEQLGSVDGRLSYPTLSVLNADMEIIYQHGGYLSAKELSTLLALVKKEQKK